MVKLVYLFCVFIWILSGIILSFYVQVFVVLGGKIIDFIQDIYIVDFFFILVENFFVFISDSFGFSKVCFIIIYFWVLDLKVELQSFDGISIWLINRNGGDDVFDYYNICFCNNGFFGYIYQVCFFFVGGEFILDGRLGFINNG